MSIHVRNCVESIKSNFRKCCRTDVELVKLLLVDKNELASIPEVAYLAADVFAVLAP